jgi:hypothetical protein
MRHKGPGKLSLQWQGVPILGETGSEHIFAMRRGHMGSLIRVDMGSSEHTFAMRCGHMGNLIRVDMGSSEHTFAMRRGHMGNLIRVDMRCTTEGRAGVGRA